jgi:hypothetical protein
MLASLLIDATHVVLLDRIAVPSWLNDTTHGGALGNEHQSCGYAVPAGCETAAVAIDGAMTAAPRSATAEAAAATARRILMSSSRHHLRSNR